MVWRGRLEDKEEFLKDSMKSHGSLTEFDNVKVETGVKKPVEE